MKKLLKNLLNKHSILTILLVVITIISSFSYMCSFFNLKNNIITLALDLFSHWQMLYFYCAITLFMFCFNHHKKLSLCCLAIVSTVFFSQFYQPFYSQKNDNFSYKIISSNVLFTTKNLDYLDKLIQKENADLIYLMEVNYQHINQLEYLSKLYNYRLISEPKNHPFGYAILSKSTLNIQKVTMPENYLYFEDDNKCVALVHLMPPISLEAKKLRDTTFNNMFSKIKSCNKKVSLIAGDFNASSWSYPLVKLKEYNYYSGSHIQPTWPTLFKKIVGINIDHIIVNQPYKFTRYEIINPSNGSDHYTLIAEIK